MARMKPTGSAPATEKEREVIKRKAFNKAQERRKQGDFTPIKALMREELKNNYSKWLIEERKKHSNSTKEEEGIRKDSVGLLDKLRGKKPSLADLDEWKDTEPPSPTFGGMALEEERLKRRKAGRY